MVADLTDATGGTLYAATWIGVYVTSDGGNSWNQLGSALPNVAVYDVYKNVDTLYAGSYGRSVLSISLSGSSSSLIPRL